MGNLLLRVGFALSIVFTAIGLTFAAPNGFARSEAATATPAASVTAVVAGYQAAPLAADRASTANAPTPQSQQAATLVALATTVVLLAIFVILFSYRPRPGGVRASHR
jgi:heme/copper-type cytochrome/quinol oxidase subunit 4